MNKTLFFVDESVTNENILKIKNEKDAIVIPLNYRAQKKLEVEKIKTEISDKLLIDKDYELIDKITGEIPIKWHNSDKITQALKFNGVNMGFLIEKELTISLLPIIHRIFLVSKILKKHNPNFIFIICSKDTIGKIPKLISKQMGYKFKNLPSKEIKNEFKFDKYKITLDFFGKNFDITLSRKKFFLIKKIYEKFWIILFNLTNLQSKREKEKKILLLDFHLINYKSILKEFKTSKWENLFLNNRRPLIWNSESLKIAKEIDAKLIHFTNSTISKNESNDIINGIINVIETDNTIESKFEVLEFNIWEIIKIDLINLCKKRIPEIVKDIDRAFTTLKDRKIDLVLTLDDSQQTERGIILAAKKIGIPVFMLQNGVI
jgi:hypothetical protein